MIRTYWEFPVPGLTASTVLAHSVLSWYLSKQTPLREVSRSFYNYIAVPKWPSSVRRNHSNGSWRVLISLERRTLFQSELWMASRPEGSTSKSCCTAPRYVYRWHRLSPDELRGHLDPPIDRSQSPQHLGLHHLRHLVWKAGFGRVGQVGHHGTCQYCFHCHVGCNPFALGWRYSHPWP